MAKHVTLRSLSSALADALRRALGPQPLRWARWLAAAKPSRRVKRLSSGETRVYHTWRIVVPSHAAEELGLDPEVEDVHLLVLAARLRWYHLLDPAEHPDHWDSLPDTARAEACLAGLASKNLCGNISFAVVVGPEEELRRHGLTPRATVHVRELAGSRRGNEQS